MNAFGWGIFGAFAGFVLVMMLIVAGIGLGKEDLRGQYRQCIVLGAPQENCINKFLGEK